MIFINKCSLSVYRKPLLIKWMMVFVISITKYKEPFLFSFNQYVVGVLIY
ncbi:hypothetical protein CIT292_09848 [Citrobacter youngae ATCC 29220]|uniref:Uncharacterized protein n=1 Tax=Citrobacter youngae ATCC 29220 TaxID=500640 RepID=D4BH41_9ENTR|nr:hypothetical protein CIT292_09848 [Citrobacter youngae ATCC 29220]